jgi:CHAT domain-containing protein
MPLHAAGIYDAAGQECCSDYVVSSYTPTLSALARARTGFIPLHRQNTHLLAVAEPDAPEKPRLYQVKKELESLSTVIETNSGLEVECLISPNVEAVIGRLPEANIIHLACHGIQNWQDALDSGFCLHDGDLKITQLMRMDLNNGFLAYLSACETAKGDRVQPDQTIHLAAAMLFAGFRSVIATMWYVLDFAEFMKRS